VEERLQGLEDLHADLQPSANVAAPAGTTMNSWRSREFCAWRRR
jgi:hypothetical protein